MSGSSMSLLRKPWPNWTSEIRRKPASIFCWPTSITCWMIRPAGKGRLRKLCGWMGLAPISEGTEGYWAKYQANMTFAKAATTDVRKFYEFASQAMAELDKRDPTEARFHFLLADLYYLLDDTASWEREAQEALRLDGISTDIGRNRGVLGEIPGEYDLCQGRHDGCQEVL